ncbi:hypothetical protein ACIA58_19440 [Kribbella sp. NPDC051586]|uniref:hypothetical protein n=1 Tax=Kribbella sp. NPDC051586 TaxID=3364118 RepID=UPI0037B6C69C
MSVSKEGISRTIIELEKSFNERWSAGDNRGYLDGFAEEVSDFDSSLLEDLVVGRDKVVAWVDSVYSHPHIVRSSPCRGPAARSRCSVGDGAGLL